MNGRRRAHTPSGTALVDPTPADSPSSLASWAEDMIHFTLGRRDAPWRGATKAVLLELLHAAAEDRTPTLRELAELIGRREAAVTQAIRELKTLGIGVRSAGKGRAPGRFDFDVKQFERLAGVEASSADQGWPMAPLTPERESSTGTPRGRDSNNYYDAERSANKVEFVSGKDTIVRRIDPSASEEEIRDAEAIIRNLKLFIRVPSSQRNTVVYWTREGATWEDWETGALSADASGERKGIDYVAGAVRNRLTMRRLGDDVQASEDPSEEHAETDEGDGVRKTIAFAEYRQARC